MQNDMEMKILCVEDNEVNVFVMQHSLKEYDMEIAMNGRQAMERAKNFKYDLILMDINLGPNEKDGNEVMTDMKKISGYEEVPFYAVTAYAMNGDEEKFLERGFEKYFKKPVDFTLLKQSIESLKV